VKQAQWLGVSTYWHCRNSSFRAQFKDFNSHFESKFANTALGSQ
jgi:hypothetical protein